MSHGASIENTCYHQTPSMMIQSMGYMMILGSHP